ncbi:acetate--CoA ligase family protein [Paraburkholderia sediminicola]|uniref:acetate--CoA ligase family protein n=1 Tax=Paraburkholderia sediminicola TaxID=458836 RepID=UPI0038BA7904
MTPSPLSSLFSPKSVAILGISPQRSHGQSTFLNLQKGRFEGSIYLVHPTSSLFEGEKVYASLDVLPQVPECVVLAISAEKVLEQLEVAGRMGVRAAVVYASGFAESNQNGQRREAELVETAKRFDIQLCGPNCMGLVDFYSGFSAYSGSWPEIAHRGSVAILSHSGSGCVVLGNTGRFGVSRMASVGNGSVLDMADYLNFLAEDSETRVVAMVVETLRNPAAFKAAAEKMARAGKRIVALKNGRSTKGAAATIAHTGAIAGPHEAYAEFFRECGVITVADLDELVESTALLEQLTRHPIGTGVAIIGISGGEMAMACDLAEDVGLRLADLTNETKVEIERSMPNFAYASNPLDARTGSPDVYEQLLCALASDPEVALVAVGQDSSHTLSDNQVRTYAGVARALTSALDRIQKPIVFYNNTKENVHPLIAAPLRESGVPILLGARNGLLAISRLMQMADRSITTTTSNRPQLQANPRWIQRFQLPMPPTEREAKEFLAECGLPVMKEAFAENAMQCADLAEEIGFPVAIKIESPDIAHKTEVGGVVLNLASAAEVSIAFEDMLATVKHNCPDARINGVVVQEMVSSGVEVLIGLSRQEPFGLALAIGWGGIQVEIQNDVRLMLLPCSRATIVEKLDQTRVAKLLKGFRGAPPADQDALIDVALKLSEIGRAYGHVIDAIDINPVAVLPKGEGVRLLDVLIETRAQKK